MAESVITKDGLEVSWKGTFSRHGVAIVTLAILGGAAGAGIGYAISVHAGMSRGWCMGVGGFVGFALVGGVSYAVFNSIDRAELAAEKFAKTHIEASGYRIPAASAEEKANSLADTMIEVLERFGFEEEKKEKKAA
jgi:hypothetical protein